MPPTPPRASYHSVMCEEPTAPVGSGAGPSAFRRAPSCAADEPDVARKSLASASLAPFSAASYNVFIGTPLPFPTTQSPYVAMLGTPGEGASRLVSQLARLRAELPSILGLQELHDDALPPAFARAFDTHTLLVGRSPNALGAALFLAWRALLVAFGGACASAVSALAGLSTVAALVCAALAGVGLPAAFLPQRCTPAAFLTSSTSAGLALFVDRARFTVLLSETRAFAHQRGDLLNILKPRGFQRVVLESVAGKALLVVIHAHTNLGSDAHRSRQIEELAAASGAEALADVLARAGRAGAAAPADVPVLILGDLNASFQGCVAAVVEAAGFCDAFVAAGGDVDALSWDSRNPLTKGLAPDPDGRLDHVLWRAGAARVAPGSARLMLNEAPYVSDHFGVRVDFHALPSSDDSGAEDGEGGDDSRSHTRGGTPTDQSISSEDPTSPRSIRDSD
jgi:endonuclease/exonuclease/phosphatase family metal-dependent hydrolase